MDTLGHELKRRREERNIALRDVAEATRLGVRFLHAIEADDYSSLPGGIYARSFIRAYAKYIGMDEEEAVARYRKQTQSEELAEPQITFQDFSNEPSSRSLYVWMVALLAVIVGGSWATLHYIDRKNPAPPPITAAVPAAATTVKASTANVPDANAPLPVPAATQPTTNVAAQPAPTPAATQPAANTAVQPVVENVDGVILTVKTSGQSWVSVRSDEQQNSQMQTLQPGETRDFKANSKMKVTIGNLPAVQLFINGQPAKLPSANGLLASNTIITKENYHDYINAAAGKDLKAAKPATKLTAGKPATTTTQPAVKPAVKPAANQAAINKPAAAATPRPVTSNTTPAVKPPAPKPNPAVNSSATKPAATNTTKPAATNTAKPAATSTTGTTGSSTAKPPVAKPNPATTTSKPAAKPEGTAVKTDKPANKTTAAKPAEKPKAAVKTESKPE